MDLEFSNQLYAARGGATIALGVLLEAYRPFLHFVADQKIPTDLQAKLGSSDLVQETFLEAARDFATFRGTTEAEFVTWLEQILCNNVINSAQRFRQAKRRVDKEIPLDDTKTGAGLRNALASREETPSNDAMNRETVMAMANALDKLPEDYRQVIKLRHSEHLSYTEIAKRMQRSEEAVRKLWARAVEKWRLETDTSHVTRFTPDTND